MNAIHKRAKKARATNRLIASFTHILLSIFLFYLCAVVQRQTATLFDRCNFAICSQNRYIRVGTSERVHICTFFFTRILFEQCIFHAVRISLSSSMECSQRKRHTRHILQLQKKRFFFSLLFDERKKKKSFIQ